MQKHVKLTYIKFKDLRKVRIPYIFIRILFVYCTFYGLSWSNVNGNLAEKINMANVVTILPGTDLQELVDQNPPGTTFLIQAGTHRLQQIRPKNNDSFVGTAGAILSGATVIKNFIQQDKYWVADVAIPDIPQKGKCERLPDGTPFDGCMFANDLFLDNQALMQVMSLRHVEAGKWFIDQKFNKVYISDNPIGKILEISTTRYAIYGSSNNISIRNLIIEKYANPAQEGAIHPMNAAQGPLGRNWEIDSNEVRLNHGVGIRVGHQMQVTNNNIHHNGQLGIGGAGNNITIEANEIAYNNTKRFDSHWEAGGSKFSHTTNLTVKGNYVHHNTGPGLWTDGNNIHTLYEGNRVLENTGPGIFHEISYSAIIKDNVVEKNGFKFQRWLEGAGILVSASSDVEVLGNTVRNNFHGICGIQTKRGEGEYGPHEIRNLNVHNNIIVMERGMNGLVVQDLNHSYFNKKNNRFQKNTYYLAEQMGASFRWFNGSLNGKEWQQFGQDVDGSFF